MAIKIGDTITDGTAVFTVRRKSHDVVGEIKMFAGSTTPFGYLLCDGSAVSRTNYANLFAVIGTTYGSGDGSSTFNLPNFTDRVAWGSSTVGTVKSAGLPNITGDLGYMSKLQDITTRSGVFTGTSTKSITGIGISPIVSSNHVGGMGAFDASCGNSIYGNSTTVQPPALTTRFIIKY